MSFFKTFVAGLAIILASISAPAVAGGDHHGGDNGGWGGFDFNEPMTIELEGWAGAAGESGAVFSGEDGEAGGVNEGGSTIDLQLLVNTCDDGCPANSASADITAWNRGEAFAISSSTKPNMAALASSQSVSQGAVGLTFSAMRQNDNDD